MPLATSCRALVPVIVALARSARQTGQQITRAERERLGVLLKGLEVEITGLRPLTRRSSLLVA